MKLDKKKLAPFAPLILLIILLLSSGAVMCAIEKKDRQKYISQDLFREYYLHNKNGIKNPLNTIPRTTCLIANEDIQKASKQEANYEYPTGSVIIRGSYPYHVNVEKYYPCFDKEIETFLMANDRPLTLAELERYFTFKDEKIIQNSQFVAKMAEIKADKIIMISEYLDISNLYDELKKIQTAQDEEAKYKQFFDDKH